MTEHNDASVHEVQDWGRVRLSHIIPLIFQCPQSRTSISMIQGSREEGDQMVMSSSPYPRTSMAEHNDAPIQEEDDFPIYLSPSPVLNLGLQSQGSEGP